MDDTEDARKYKAKHNREIDNLFRANGMIQSQVAGTDAYRRGHTWNFEWCSEDPTKARPDLVRFVNHAMASGVRNFEESFNMALQHDARNDCAHDNCTDSKVLERVSVCEDCKTEFHYCNACSVEGTIYHGLPLCHGA